MHYVIIRDDDTNALTPVKCLDRLYRPFLERGLPVNLAVIPEVSTAAKMGNDKPEGFLVFKDDKSAAKLCHPISSNSELVEYLRDNSDYHVVQHGCHHDYREFDRPSRKEIGARLDTGLKRLLEAGFPQPDTFVAPYDRLSRAAFLEVSSRFRIISSGWYELRRLPLAWWPSYLGKKLRDTPHWRAGSTRLLSHPGCLLSYTRNCNGMLDSITSRIQSQRLTVLVTHWWEYFRDGHPDDSFIAVLHETADYLATHPQIKVISFSDLASGKAPLN